MTTEGKTLENLISSAKNIAVMPSRMSSIDNYSASVGLYHMVKDVADGKNVYFVYPDKIPSLCENLLKKEEILKNVSNRELQVSIDYSNSKAAAVHWYTKDDVLHLKLSPIERDFDLHNVTTLVQGYSFDLVITLGVQHLSELGFVYTELEEEIKSAQIVNIDNTSLNSQFGHVNVVDTLADTVSLLVLKKSVEWGLSVGTKAAAALLTGISHKESTALSI